MKTADQVQSHRHHNQYGGEPQNLSQPQLDGQDAPIDLALWGSAEINLPDSIDLLAGVFNTHRQLLIREVYKKLENPKRRLAFGFGLIFADAASRFSGVDPFWKTTCKARSSMPPTLGMPVFSNLVRYWYEDVRFYMATALLGESERIAAIARTHEVPFESAVIALALLLATDCDDSERNWSYHVDEVRGFALEMMVRWMDEWANIQLQSTMKQPQSGPVSSLGRSGARSVKKR